MSRQCLPNDDRGQAEQIDFLNGMVILLFGAGLFFASGSVLFAVGVDSNPDRQGAAVNADQRLVADLLVNDTGAATLDRDCLDAYFGMSPEAVCARADGLVDGATSETAWLRRSLGLEDRLEVNVTVVDEGGVVTGPGGVTYALGESPPSGAAVFESNRFVTVDGEYWTVLVRVW